MAPIRACMMGKIGIGKSTLIEKLLGKNADWTAKVPEVSADRVKGCTKGIQVYGGDKQKYELYDSEGVFGLFDDFPGLVNKLAKELKGKKLHSMCCCINAQGLTRLDKETMESILMCAGILGEVGAENLLLVFTKCDTKDAIENVMGVFEALQTVAANEEYRTILEESNTHIAQGVTPLFSLIQKGMLGFAMVEKDNVAGVVQALDAFSEARNEVVVKPSPWVLGKKIWADLKSGIGRILGMVHGVAPLVAPVAELAGMPSLKVFMELIQVVPASAAPPADAPIMFYPPKDMAKWVRLGREPHSSGISESMDNASARGEESTPQKRPRCSESQDAKSTVKKRAKQSDDTAEKAADPVSKVSKLN